MSNGDVRHYRSLLYDAARLGYKPFHNLERITDSSKEKIYDKLVYMELCLVQRWLREVYKIHVMPHHDNTCAVFSRTFVGELGITMAINTKRVPSSIFFDNYSESFIAGLRTGMNLIKNLNQKHETESVNQ